MSKVLPTDPLTPSQEKRVHSPSEAWSDMFAAKVAVQDYRTAERYRAQNHDHRWRNADQLYVAYQQKKTWRGTRIPRSSLGVFLVFQQVESFIPRAMSALFSQDPWFETVALRGAPVEAAKAAQDILIAQFEKCNIREHVREAVKSALVYGNGILELEWFHEERKVREFVPEDVPKRVRVQGVAGPTLVPTGEFTRRLKETIVTKTENRPIVTYRSLAKFFIDPNTASQNPKDARFVATRDFMFIDELTALEGKDNFKIPPREIMLMASIQKPPSEDDTTSQGREIARSGAWIPTEDTTIDAGGKRVEVIKYWTRDRLVWAMTTPEGVWPLLNIPNPFGFIPFYNFSYADLLDRFYAMSLSDVLEGEQRFQAGLKNARVDEISLSLHPTTVHRRGINVPESQLRQVPGALIPAEDPDKGVTRLFPKNVTSESHMETAASEQAAQRTTGLNDTAVSGVSGGNNPTGRTATGAGAQVQAALSRIQYFVENAEVNSLEPILRDANELNKKFLDPNQRISAADGREIDPIEIFQAEVGFKMRASSRMASKQGILQTFPMIFQAIAQPQLSAQLAMQGKKVDYQSAVNFLLETVGYSGRVEIFTDLTDEEKQAIAQRQEQESDNQAKQNLQNTRMKDLGDLQDQKFKQDTVKQLLVETLKAQVADVGETEE